MYTGILYTVPQMILALKLLLFNCIENYKVAQEATKRLCLSVSQYNKYKQLSWSWPVQLKITLLFKDSMEYHINWRCILIAISYCFYVAMPKCPLKPIHSNLCSLSFFRHITIAICLLLIWFNNINTREELGQISSLKVADLYYYCSNSHLDDVRCTDN